MKILFAGGGTGGHIIPIIAIIREIRKIYQKQDLQFYYIGPEDDFGSVLLSQEGVKMKRVLAGKVRRYPGWNVFWENFVDVCFKIPLGILQSFFYIFFLSPDLVFSKGGYGAIPWVIAARMLFVPVFMHESDIAPGAANKIISRFVKEVFVSFPRTEYFPLKKMILVGNPIRRELLNGTKEEARILFKISSEKPVVLILGGSQGAQKINEEVFEVIQYLLESFEIIHQCGENNLAEAKKNAKVMVPKELENSYHLFSFLKEPELKQAYAVADLIVSRSGSGSIFEIAAIGKPSILVPLQESAQNHQVKNAYAYTETGAGIVIEESNFTSRFFMERIKSILNDPAEYAKMAEKAKEFAKPEAAKALADYTLGYLTQN
jgi:UDP-N-acetylglucosamine--N-acetylmuramyl-(pentapeptide) pyrophosphoryl-undecaprenol N-acetylglucosamine transferase